LRPSRLAKVIARGLRVTWRDEPTQHDIEALDANIRRVGLVIRLRWVLVLVLALFSLAATGVYTTVITLEELMQNLVIPSMTLVFVLAYNSFYQVTYRRLGNVAFLNHAQLMFDILVVAVLIHYSGGVYSWFYAMFLLFILEGAFILPRNRDVWLLTAFASVVYAAILLGQYAGVLSHVPVPFVANDLPGHAAYMSVRLLWVLTILAGTASISSFLMNEVRGREQRLSEAAILDEGTGLCNRPYFLSVLGAEVNRARRTDGAVGVLLLDIDDFTRFNETFGYAAGNRMIKAIADELSFAVEEGEDADPDLVTLCRWGGEEFALVVPGEPAPGGDDSAFYARLGRLAERLRLRVRGARVDDMGVTVSVGAAVYPDDGGSVDDILTAIDQAVATSCEAGGDRVTLCNDTAA
jgi:diguanylate cyclase (GGDEF)-like protein